MPVPEMAGGYVEAKLLEALVVGDARDAGARGRHLHGRERHLDGLAALRGREVDHPRE